MNKIRIETEMDQNALLKRPIVLKLFSLHLLTMCLVTGCVSPNAKPAYPPLAAGTPASVLKLDNTMTCSMWAQFKFKAAIGVSVTIDGFSPLEPDKLKSGWQPQSKELIPKGITEVRLPAGSHTLVHKGQGLGQNTYYFNPVNMTFDTEEGKTYVIRFKNTTRGAKIRYAVEYEGWSTEQSSQWPNEVGVANPIFGH
jgi:hypothetical protein